MSLNTVFFKGERQTLRWNFDHLATWDLVLYRYDPKQKPEAQAKMPIKTFDAGSSDSDDISWDWTVDPGSLGFKSPMSIYWLQFYSNSTLNSSNGNAQSTFWSHFFNITDVQSKATNDSDAEPNKNHAVTQSWGDLNTATKVAICAAGVLALFLFIAIIASLIIWRRLLNVRYMSQPRSRLPSFDSIRELRASSNDISEEYHAALAEKKGRYYSREIQALPRALMSDADGKRWRDQPVFH